MNNETFTFKINAKTGEVKMDVENSDGINCKEVTAPIEQKLGASLQEVKRTLKTEFYNAVGKFNKVFTR